jgi:hypothetical protein
MEFTRDEVENFYPSVRFIAVTGVKIQYIFRAGGGILFLIWKIPLYIELIFNFHEFCHKELPYKTHE